MYMTPDLENRQGEPVEKKTSENFDYMSLLRIIGLIIIGVMFALNFIAVLFKIYFDIFEGYSDAIAYYLNSALDINFMIRSITVLISVIFPAIQIYDWIKKAKDYPTKSKIQIVVLLVLTIANRLCLEYIFECSIQY